MGERATSLTQIIYGQPKVSKPSVRNSRETQSKVKVMLN